MRRIAAGSCLRLFCIRAESSPGGPTNEAGLVEIRSIGRGAHVRGGIPMPQRVLSRFICAALIAVAPPLAAAIPAFGAPHEPEPGPRSVAPPVSDTTWVDADGRPIPKPRDWEPNFYGTLFREVLVDPLAHAFDIPDKLLDAAKPAGVHRRREAANVNAVGEVPNTIWFT